MSLKKHLTVEQIAAIASGAVIDTGVQTPSPEEVAAAEAAAVAAAAAAAAKTPEQIAADTAAQAEADRVAAEAAAASVAPPAESELVKFLRTELAAANTNLIAKEVELTGLRAEAMTARETQPKLLEIARGAVGRMKIALGGSDGAASTLSAVEVIAAHAETSEIFAKKFIVGGAASTGAATETPAKKPAPTNVTPIFSAVAKSATK